MGMEAIAFIASLKYQARADKYLYLLTPCTHVTRGDCAMLTILVGNRLRLRRLKCALHWITHNDIAHQYGASKITLMITSGQ